MGLAYRGVLYAGLMITEDGPKVLEFNCRFGDPECQPIMMRLESDLPSLLLATAEGSAPGSRGGVVGRGGGLRRAGSSAGYPGEYKTGMEIEGLDALDSWGGGYAFHAGTAREGDRWVTRGGRVLGVTARGDTITAATRAAYEGVGRINWDGMHYRRDIARRAMDRAVTPPTPSPLGRGRGEGARAERTRQPGTKEDTP